MDEREVLLGLGLSEGEVKTYLTLLKLGSTTVSEITKNTNQHRTTIYDFLEKLLDRGLVNYVVKNNVKFYKVTNPNKLIDVLREKEEQVRQIMPKLQGFYESDKQEVKVEVYKGKEGLKAVMLDGVKSGEEILGIGIDEELYKNALPVFVEQYQKLQKKYNTHERILTKANPGYLFDRANTDYKFVSREMFSPTSTLIYGNKIQMVLWEPSLTTLLIENKQLAASFRDHFNVLWKQESMIFRGNDDIKSLFDDILRTVKPEEEYVAFGLPSLSKYWVDYFDGFCDELDRNKIKTKLIFDEAATGLMEMGARHDIEMRTLEKKHMTPAEVDIYGDKVAIILWAKEPQAFVINNKDIAKSFKQYFEVIWKTAKKYKGKANNKT